MDVIEKIRRINEDEDSQLSAELSKLPIVHCKMSDGTDFEIDLQQVQAAVQGGKVSIEQVRKLESFKRMDNAINDTFIFLI